METQYKLNIVNIVEKQKNKFVYIMKDCCILNKNTKKCIRKDNKIFTLPRKFTRKQCENKKGFSMYASCAPYKFCNSKGGSRKTKLREKNKSFFFNPKNPDKSFDVYIDKNQKDTISIKYTTYEDVVNTINKLEKLYKENKYTHKRIWQVGMILMVRLRVLQNLKPKQYYLAKKYFKFLSKRTKVKNDKERKMLTFTC